MFLDGKFTLDEQGDVEMRDPHEIRYRSGRGGAWYESDHFFWHGRFDGVADILIDTVLVRPAHQPTVYKETWPYRLDGDGPPWLALIGPISFMPISWGIHVVEIRIHGGPVQRQRIDIIRCD